MNFLSSFSRSLIAFFYVNQTSICRNDVDIPRKLFNNIFKCSFIFIINWIFFHYFHTSPHNIPPPPAPHGSSILDVMKLQNPPHYNPSNFVTQRIINSSIVSQWIMRIFTMLLFWQLTSTLLIVTIRTPREETSAFRGTFNILILQ